MIRAVRVIRAGEGAPPCVDTVILDRQARHRRRIAMMTEGGLRFVLDLPQATELRDGDGLVLEDGGVVTVQAKPEALLEISGRDPHHLARLAWHLGNRHVLAAIEPERILIAPDPVLRQMLIGLGATVGEVEALFDPEPGAYAQQGDPDTPAHNHSHA